MFLRLVLMIVPNESSGESISSNLNIRVRVQPFLEYKIIKKQSDLIIGPDDIKKGYVAINDGLIFSVTTNNPGGYILWMRSGESEYVSHILIMTEDNNSYELYPGKDIEIQMPYRGHPHDIVKVRFRIYLKPETKAGEYVWPILASVHPL